MWMIIKHSFSNTCDIGIGFVAILSIKYRYVIDILKQNYYLSIMQKLTFHFQNGQRIIQQIGLIDEFKGKWALQMQNLSAEHLKHIQIAASNDNAVASMQLENVVNATRERLDAYQNALNIVLNPTTLFTHQTIEYLYVELEPQNTNVDFKKYRNIVPKLVLAIEEQLISFRATPTQDVLGQLRQQIQKTTVLLERKSIHPLIATADFMYEWAALAPFETRNLQLSRLIAMLLLKYSNYNFMDYLSLETILLARKAAYQASLAKALHSRNQVKEDISDWIIFLLDCILLSINHLEQQLGSLKLESIRQNQPVQNQQEASKPVNAKNKMVDTPKSVVTKRVHNNQNQISTGNLFDVNPQSAMDISKEPVKVVPKIEKTPKSNAAVKIEEPLKTSDVYLSSRQKKLKKFISEKQPVRLNDLKTAFPEINQHIMRKDLQYMHRMNEIQKIGDYKNTVYTVEH
jgi:hypothetical protein